MHDVVLERIQSRRWKPGDLIPREQELAEEFGCARATINRALQALADSGFLERRRKAGTRVAIHPVRKATLSIPIIEQEIEQNGFTYAYALLTDAVLPPPADIGAWLEVPPDSTVRHVEALHSASGRPYVFEDRWIHLDAIGAAASADFSTVSPNRWLVENATYTRGKITLSAIGAGSRESELLACEPGAALFRLERRTWNKTAVITVANLTFAPGYRMHTML
ncbi:MAG: UTRA domain-containing protein [Nitratireductor sp.]|nr:UTRA domain-containing protein [Nitratireductor sp.]